MLRKSLLVLGMMVVGGQAAQPADIARPVYKAAPVIAAPMYNWSGFYFGGHAGYGWAKSTSTVVDATGPAFPVGTQFGASPEGFLGGLQAGFNWQAGNWVFGIEGEYSWADIDSSDTYLSAFAPVTNRATRTIDGIGTVTGRLGYAWDNSLIYAKGGWAWASSSASSVTTNPAGVVVFATNSDSNRNGWTIGAGWEYGFAPSWSFKVEYNYLDFGTASSLAYPVGGGAGLRRDVDLDMHILKAGVNYRFDWGGKSPVMAKY